MNATATATAAFGYLDILYDAPKARVDILEAWRQVKALNAKTSTSQRAPDINTGNLERHYRIKELAALWGFCQNTITKMVKDEPGVLKLSNSRPGKRHKVSYSIPESVVLRLKERISQDVFQPPTTRRNPLRVIRLRDLDRTVTKKPGNLPNRNIPKKKPHGESIA